MSTSQATTSFYPGSIVSLEFPIVDPELQRLISELDHLDTSISLGSLLRGAPEQGAVFDSVAFAVDDERYLALYDLCGSDPTLVDSLKWECPDSSIASSTAAPPLVAATLSPTSDDSSFPAPTVGGKWAPSFHPGLVPLSMRYAPTAPTPPAPVAVVIPHPATPDPAPAPASRSAGPSRSSRTTNRVRNQPYRKAAPAPRKARGSGKTEGRIGRVETRDYLEAYPARAENITLLQGYRGLIRTGRWGPIILDALTQIGVPYPMMALQKLLSELYDGEGEQEGIPKGAKGRPLHPWKVSFKSFLISSTGFDDNDYRVHSLGMCASRRKGTVPFRARPHSSSWRTRFIHRVTGGSRVRDSSRTFLP